MDRDDTINSGRLLGTPKQRASMHGFDSSSTFRRHHHHHYQHHHRRSEKDYFLEEIKEAMPPTFYGEMNKSKDVEAWLLGMRKNSRLHDYLENVKAKVATFCLKGKADI